MDQLFEYNAFDIAIDKGTLDAMLTGNDDRAKQLPNHIIQLLHSISNITRTSYILISHTPNRKYIHIIIHV